MTLVAETKIVVSHDVLVRLNKNLPIFDAEEFINCISLLYFLPLDGSNLIL